MREVQPLCGTCRANVGDPPAPSGVVYEDGLWRFEHAFEPIPMAGWFVLKPLRHVENLADLSPDETSTYGPLVVRLAGAMTAALGPERVYSALFAEHPRHRHVHVHVHLIARPPEWPAEHRGPRVFDLLATAAKEERNLASPEEAARMAAAVREALG